MSSDPTTSQLGHSDADADKVQAELERWVEIIENYPRLVAERDRLLASRDELAIDLAKAYGDCDRLGEAIQTALRGVTDEDWEFVHATLREALDG